MIRSLVEAWLIVAVVVVLMFAVDAQREVHGSIHCLDPVSEDLECAP